MADQQGQNGRDAQAENALGRNFLIAALILSIGVIVVEIVGGWASGSLALLADAGLVLATAVAIAVALFTAWAEGRPASIERTFGYHRLEVAGSMLGALALWLVAGWILFESINRIQNRADIDIAGGQMFVFAIIGTAVNVVAAAVLLLGSRNSRRTADAFRHSISDFLGSIAVLVAAILVRFSELPLADPIISIGIAALIAASSWRLILKVFYAIMEGTPENLDLYRLCADIESVPGVTLIHDVHAWSISEGYNALTAHVVLEPGGHADIDSLMSDMRRIVYGNHGIDHLTIQFERSATECHENHHLEHLQATSMSER